VSWGPAGARAQVAWTVALVLLATGAALGVDHHGTSSRLPFSPPDDLRGARWVVVQDAAAAVDLWSAAGLRGRRVLVATGRWGKPVAPDPAAGAARSTTDDAAGRVGAALFDATMRGLARELVVVMPDAAFDARIAAIRSSRETTLFDGWARQPFHGIPRSFHRPATLPHLDEPVLLLVEPSFLAEGAPPDLPAWLEARGVRFDLGLIAARDPEATAAQADAVLALAARLGAVPVEVDR
jgi:hypothetical protein